MTTTAREDRVLRFDSEEAVRFCERFGIEANRCTNIEISIGAPGLVGYATFTLRLLPGDIAELGGQVEPLPADKNQPPRSWKKLR